MMKEWTSNLAFALFGGILAMYACSNKSEPKETKKVSDNQVFIKPPIPQIDVKYASFEVDAEKGGKFTYPSGTEIEIPANALVDKSGKAIKGKVNLAYREFHDALDVFASGIPMKYDSAGVAQNFQTAGMFDIKASQANQAVFVAKDQKIKVKMASFQAETDYNFYTLDTLKQQWAYQTRGKTEVNQEKLKQKALIESQKPAKFSDMLILNYGQAVDVAFNDDWKTVEKNLPTFKNKIKTYGVDYWNDVRAMDEIVYQGNKYPAYLMVWKKLENTAIPNWVKSGEYIRNVYDRYNQKTKEYELSSWVKTQNLGNGVYQLSIKHKNNYFNLKMTPVMRIASLLQFSPEYWQKQYNEAMAKVSIEEEKIRNVADVFRPIEVAQFGIYNYDRLLKEPEAVVVKADFDLENQNKPNLVYYISAKTRGVVPYKPNQWKTVSLVPDTTARIFAVMPDYSVAFYKPAEYAKIDFKKLKAEYTENRQPSYHFTLNAYPDLVKSKEELKKALGLN